MRGAWSVRQNRTKKNRWPQHNVSSPYPSLLTLSPRPLGKHASLRPSPSPSPPPPKARSVGRHASPPAPPSPCRQRRRRREGGGGASAGGEHARNLGLGGIIPVLAAAGAFHEQLRVITQLAHARTNEKSQEEKKNCHVGRLDETSGVRHDETTTAVICLLLLLLLFSTWLW